MERPKPLSPVEAYETIQRPLELRDNIAFTSHARQRMRDRQFTVDYYGQRCLIPHRFGGALNAASRSGRNGEPSITPSPA